MRDSSAVLIQLLDILTERMRYSDGDVKDVSGSFLIYVRCTCAYLPPPTGRVLRNPYAIKVLAIEARS